MKYRYYQILIAIFVLLTGLCSSCSKWLDRKPDSKLVVISTLNDLQSLLNNDGQLLQSFSAQPEIASDNYYLTNGSFNGLSQENRDRYIWSTKADAATLYDAWAKCYGDIYIANLVLENLERIKINEGEKDDYNSIKGQALFIRSWAMYHLVLIWTNPYSTTANDELGVPIRKSIDPAEVFVRPPLEENYTSMISDLKEAINLLPPQIDYKTRPSKAAAYGLLARIYLKMNDYENALQNASDCLKTYSTLLDYNTINAAANAPFPQFNTEVVYHCTTVAGSINQPIDYRTGVVDSTLYKMFDDFDIRKRAFFGNNADGTHYFKGNYMGSRSYARFNGLCTDEIWLISAECKARLSDIKGALEDLNTLRKNRYPTGNFFLLTEDSSPDIIQLTLDERRKQLCFRSGIRWLDIKRLSNDTKYKINPRRVIEGREYLLLKEGFRSPIPKNVVEISGIEQH